MRDSFSKKAIDARLRKDFSLTQNVEVLLDLPDTTTWRKVPIEGPAPGTPHKNVLIGSEQRSRLSLAELAQQYRSGDVVACSLMWVEISGADEGQRQKLRTGITQAYLRANWSPSWIWPCYETLIRQDLLAPRPPRPSQ